jgi:hypothetical protein
MALAAIALLAIKQNSQRQKAMEQFVFFQKIIPAMPRWVGTSERFEKSFENQQAPGFQSFTDLGKQAAVQKKYV